MLVGSKQTGLVSSVSWLKFYFKRTADIINYFTLIIILMLVLCVKIYIFSVNSVNCDLRLID